MYSMFLQPLLACSVSQDVSSGTDNVLASSGRSGSESDEVTRKFGLIFSTEKKKQTAGWLLVFFFFSLLPFSRVMF